MQVSFDSVKEGAEPISTIRVAGSRPPLEILKLGMLDEHERHKVEQDLSDKSF